MTDRSARDLDSTATRRTMTMTPGGFLDLIEAAGAEGFSTEDFTAHLVWAHQLAQANRDQEAAEFLRELTGSGSLPPHGRRDARTARGHSRRRHPSRREVPRVRAASSDASIAALRRPRSGS